ncbi:hypothetical protein [Levilactobacillus brevis]|uniref:hypothetical protein n=1 Tax=Levilactobacillus brevis TaxID=1580 RepID=UPI0022A9E5A0|nr:hypothetical protein [Levilactobacillus brevis]MCZ2120539.1 hypothetical protein [Levilactobacillus brevis]MCZ2126040.1 hypothetical protein [Levilactobacillus brevis]MCZ2210343.1 hypothetical protein [Levilactobacillus brevis]
MTPANHWHIAQGYGSDIVTTAALGWRSIWVNRDYATPTAKARPTHEIHNLAELLQWL